MILPSPYETTNFERILSNTCFSGPKKRASQGLTVPGKSSEFAKKPSIRCLPSFTLTQSMNKVCRLRSELRLNWQFTMVYQAQIKQKLVKTQTIQLTQFNKSYRIKDSKIEFIVSYTRQLTALPISQQFLLMFL